MELFSDVVSIIFSALVGLWLADFATGLFHWFVDNYCHPKWPIIGPHYIEPSHLHHEEEMFTFELSTAVTHGYIWTAVTIVGLIFWSLGLMTLTVAFALFFGFLTNIIHRWSHTRQEENVAIVTALQRVGLFQSTTHHTYHHSGNSDSHYCLLTNHINPLLEAVGFWPALDKVLSSLGVRKFWWMKTAAG